MFRFITQNKRARVWSLWLMALRVKGDFYMFLYFGKSVGFNKERQSRSQSGALGACAPPNPSSATVGSQKSLN